VAAKHWFVMVILYAGVLLGFLLYPFNFHLPNKVAGAKALPSGDGIQMDAQGGVRSKGVPTELYRRLVSGQGLSLEVWLATGGLSQRGPARMVSYSLNTDRRNFTLGQIGRGLEMRLRTTRTDLNGTNPSTRAKDVLGLNETQHLVITYDYVVEDIFVNARKVAENHSTGGDFSNWDPSYHFFLGNEATGNRPWTGKIYLVAVYSRALSPVEVLQNYRVGPFSGGGEHSTGDQRVQEALVALYRFERDSLGNIRSYNPDPSLTLEIVSEADLWHRSFLRFSKFALSQDLAGVSEDTTVNLLVLIPLGCLLFIAMRESQYSVMKCIVWTLVVGFLLSVSAESLQFFLPKRYSSLNDVLNNTIGTALGAGLGAVFIWSFRRR
jgi:hypothetical protein